MANKVRWPLEGRTKGLIGPNTSRNDFAARGGAERPPDVRVEGSGQEPHAAVGHGHVHPARVTALRAGNVALARRRLNLKLRGRPGDPSRARHKKAGR